MRGERPSLSQGHCGKKTMSIFFIALLLLHGVACNVNQSMGGMRILYYNADCTGSPGSSRLADYDCVYLGNYTRYQCEWSLLVKYTNCGTMLDCQRGYCPSTAWTSVSMATPYCESIVYPARLLTCISGPPPPPGASVAPLPSSITTSSIPMDAVAIGPSLLALSLTLNCLV